ncbi:hypothetical protein [Phenylobacterium sp.]|jgi:hypothetical protein|uniref:hypothetical protein n=1 Tax=Phenylobacterium sp. TaxID=1871053 RepID=UPI002F9232AF
MKAMLRSVVIGALALALAACATVTSAPQGTFAVGQGYQVNLGREWSDISNIMTGRPKNVRLLSIDGPLLNRLYLTDGLAPGQFLVKPAKRERPTPTYRANMAATELVEFVADSVAALDYQRVETSNLRPTKFVGADGVRFDISAQTAEGLDMAGTASVAEAGGKLYVILYLAPKEHYFAATLPEVEQVMASARRG